MESGSAEETVDKDEKELCAELETAVGKLIIGVLDLQNTISILILHDLSDAKQLTQNRSWT